MIVVRDDKTLRISVTMVKFSQKLTHMVAAVRWIGDENIKRRQLLWLLPNTVAVFLDIVYIGKSQAV